MKKMLFASALSILMLACGETPGSGTDSNQSPNEPSNMNSAPGNTMRSDTTTMKGDTTMRGSGTDSSQIPAMSTDSSQLKASSDSAMKKNKDKNKNK